MINHEHWKYLKSMEDDLVSISKYIHFSKQNADTYSVELGKIILNSCIEIERQMKKMSGASDSSKSFDRSCINDWFSPINDTYPEFRHFTVDCHLWGEQLVPWTDWEKSSPPKWWQGYNSLKHNRLDNIDVANLSNAINSVAGLLVSSIYYERIFHSVERVKGLEDRIVIHRSWMPSVFDLNLGVGMMLKDNNLFHIDF